MWELLLNGVSLLGSGASISSVASGFSLDKNVKQYENALNNIDDKMRLLVDIYSSLEQQTSDRAVEKVLRTVDGFKTANSPHDANRYALYLQGEMRELKRELITSVQSTLSDTMKEMKSAYPIDNFMNMIRTILLK